MKFQRDYSMNIEGQDLAHVVNYPLTMTFDITRNTLASANTARFTIFNLKQSTRRDIYKDRWDTTLYRQVKLQAGYVGQPNLPMIFQGNLLRAYSQRRGSDWATDLECFDGGFGIINSQVNTTLAAGWNSKQALTAALNSMRGNHVNIGAIGDFPVQSTRGLTMVGSSWDSATRLVGSGVCYVDNEKANALQKNEYILNSGGIAVINSSTGLLNAPRRQNATLEIDMLFEPLLVVGQVLRLESIETINNGTYQVIGIRHRGTISGAIGGSAVTTAILWLGTTTLQGVVQ